MSRLVVHLQLTEFEAEVLRCAMRCWEPSDESTKTEMRAVDRIEAKVTEAQDELRPYLVQVRERTDERWSIVDSRWPSTRDALARAHAMESTPELVRVVHYSNPNPEDAPDGN